jgi:phosphonate ABC transporter permease subunit PhnE
MSHKNAKPGRRFFRTFLLVIVVIVIFAYGFQVTQINLEEPKKERRQEQLLNVIRSLARPDLTRYETERLEIEAPILVPCPTTPFQLPDVAATTGPAIQLSVRCASPGSEIGVKGSGFEPGEDVFLYFVPYNADPSQAVELPLTNQIVKPNAQGNFVETVRLRRDRTSEERQTVRAVVNRTSGWPQPSASVYETTSKIIETIFLALIATSLGTILSVPISFLSARNLMIHITSTFGSWLTLLVAAPLGWWAGWWLFGTVGGGIANLITGANASVAATLAAPALVLWTVQAARHPGRSDWMTSMRGYGLGLLAILMAALVLGIVGGLGLRLGQGLATVLGNFAFLGNFLFVVSDSLLIFLPLIGGIVGAFALASLAGAASEHLLRRLGNTVWAKIYSVVVAVLAGAILFGLLAALITWLYQPANPWYYIGLAGIIGAIIFGLVALRFKPDQPIPTGMIIYYVSRTILNTLRSIEPLIMAIVFVVWVGIGPFAGVLALTLHTIASLGKLYSEQVESIAEGPIEAVTATGANRLQTIIYAVMPQIVPPYIAFTIYRWDINVRMSTIIGFAGGGGIGFLLQQNLNLLKYRQAAVQMIAIALVVATLDYISAKIREKIV